MDDKGQRGLVEENHSRTALNKLSPLIHEPQIVSPGPTAEDLLPMDNNIIALKDFVLQCSPEDSTRPAFDELSLMISGSAGRDTKNLEKVSPTMWKYHRTIQLNRFAMVGLEFTAHSRAAGKLGYIRLDKDELLAFKSVDHGTKVERDLVTERDCPSLRMTFTICMLGNINTDLRAKPGARVEAAPTVDIFSTALARLSHGKDPELLNRSGHRLMRRFKETNNEDDITKAVSAYNLAVRLTPRDHENYRVHAWDAGLALRRKFKSSGKVSDINQAISMMEDAIGLTPDDHADLPAFLNNLGSTFKIRFEYAGALADIESAISNHQRAVELIPEDHPNLPLLLSHLGDSFQSRFERTGELVDIENAISSHQQAVKLTPEGHTDLPSWLSNLANAFQRRFERTGSLEDVRSAISYHQTAIQFTPEGNTNLPSLLSNLGASLQCEFELTGDPAAIESAISNHQRAVQTTPEGHKNLRLRLGNLGNSLQRLFERTGNLADIEQAISNHQRAVQLTPNSHTDLSSSLNNLASSFQCRFKRTGDLADIENAVSNLQVATRLISEGHADFPMLLSNLGNSFQFRFERTGDLADIEGAISNHQSAIRFTSEDHPDLPSWLSNLGNSLQCRFERTGDLTDIEGAVANHQSAIRLTPEGHDNLPSWLSTLGTSFQRRFERTGDLVDIENAIYNYQKAVQLTPERHAILPSRLSNLGTSLQSRFEITNDLADIESALVNLRRAILLTPEGHASMCSRLNSLGTSFISRFEYTGDLTDIESAISNLQRAVELTPEGHINLPLWLNNLGNSFEHRFRSTQELADIESAIYNYQRAVQLTPEGDANRPSMLSNLGTSFGHRFEITGDLANSEGAISNLQRAIQLTPEGHASLCSRLINLGDLWHSRFQRTKDRADVDHAISIYRSSATQTSGHPSQRFSAARRWAMLSHQFGHADTLRAFDATIGLLSQVAGLEQTIHKRHMNLVGRSDLTTTATAVAIDGDRIKTALAWLEQGRCLVWSQISQLRSPIDNLRTHHPSLADRFSRVAHALELSGSRRETSNLVSEETMTQAITVQMETQRHVQLAKEWAGILGEVRELPGFRDFLRPPTVSDLLASIPESGTIIIFNIHKDRCDVIALVPGADEPRHIRLQSFSHQRAVELRDSIFKYLKAHGVRMREVDRTGGPTQFAGRVGVIYNVLRELWNHVAKPTLEALGYLAQNSARPRIWWCPTGPLTFLPIHAAGIYSKEKIHAGPCVSDFVVSSYTPTISTLLDKIRAPLTADRVPTNLLLISQPSTPGLPRIPATRKETHTLRDMMREEHVDSLLLEDATATVVRVTEEMKTHSWVHFACHAIQDQEHHLRSGVHLHDSRLELLEMMKQQLPNIEHAFLSACQTSTGNAALSDEAVHIAAGMLAAGYRGVVATMWSIKDDYAPEIAEYFYKDLLEGSLKATGRRQLDTSRAAHALDRSTQMIRERLGDTEDGLLTWVPYIHFGV